MSEHNIFSGLSLSLCVYSAKINVNGFNYINLGEQLEPKGDIVSINSNFIHKAITGYEYFIAKPKILTPAKKKLIALPGYKERKKVGDGTCFQSCLDFTILLDDTLTGEKNYRMRYFPKSGDLQVFGVKDEDFKSGKLVVDKFINYLKHNSGLIAFDSVAVVSTKLSLLNYKFDVKLPNQTFIDVSSMADI